MAFLMDPEFVHDRASSMGHLLGKFKITKALTRWLFSYQHPRLEQTVAGIQFKNPVGLSAGFDKDAVIMDILEDVGFGFTMIGTITNKPYEGNPKPRLYRLKKTEGIMVYYGLKNIGISAVMKRVNASRTKKFIKGISIGKTNCQETCTNEAGIADYVAGTKKVIASGGGDFYTINISCPNTFGGEPFNSPEKLDALLSEMSKLDIKKPLFLKMPIDLPWEEFRKLLEIAVQYNVTGVTIGNLSKNHNSTEIKDIIPENVQGGISGRPTWKASNDLISQTYKYYGDKLTIIGVGGIFSAEDAYEKIKRGASLVQLITGMIFVGPQLIGDINRGLVRLLERDGYSNIQEAIGADNMV